MIEEAMILINDEINNEILTITKEGFVFAKLDGKEMKRVECDKELAQAFVITICKLSSIDYHQVIEEIRKGYTKNDF